MTADPRSKIYSQADSAGLAPEGRGRLFASGGGPKASSAPDSRDGARSAQMPSLSQGPDGADELRDFLALVDYDAAYHVEAVHKESPHELTQRVFFEDGDGRRGPFIRKYLKADSGLGTMYETIFRAQGGGVCFRHVPRIHACYRLKDDLVVVMEYIEGETLQDAVRRCGPSVDLAVELFPQACAAVVELHEGFDPPVIHRDLKPSNIILSWDRLVLIDLGIARRYDSDQEADTTHFGTRDYAPPEQFGFRQTDVRSDVYALGMILHYMLAGRVGTARDRETQFAHSGIPEEFRRVVERAIAFDPDERYACVRDLEREFGRAARAFSVRRTNASRSLRLPLWLPEPIRRFSLPRWIGVVWNTLVILAWLFLMVATFVACFAPTGDDLLLPLWFRVLEYPVFLGASFTGMAYFVMDRRALRRRFVRLGAIPLWVEFVAVVGLFVVLFVVVLIVANVALPDVFASS